MNRQDLETKYVAYQTQGHLVLCLTLSTFIKSPAVAHSDAVRHMFDHHVIGRVHRCLPPQAIKQLDYDWLMEESPQGHWHYHGLMAIAGKFGSKLFAENKLNERLNGDLLSFRKSGMHRPFKINSFLIEPVLNVEAWCRYFTKQTHQF